jgi:hypothetical protein
MSKYLKKLFASPLFNKSHIEDTLFLLTATLGIVLMIGGLATIIIATNLFSQISDSILLQQSISTVLSVIPGIPFNISDLNGFGLTATGLTTWIVGINLLVIGLGIYQKNTLAKWAAILIFALAAYFSFVQFILLGVIGAPIALIELIINGVILFSFWKINFNQVPLTSLHKQPEIALQATSIETILENKETKQETVLQTQPVVSKIVTEINERPNEGPPKQMTSQPLEVVYVKDPVMSAQTEEDKKKIKEEVIEKTTRVMVPTSEIRLIIRETQPNDINGSTSRTQVIVRRTIDGVPVIIVETKNKPNVKVSVEESKQQEKK